MSSEPAPPGQSEPSDSAPILGSPGPNNPAQMGEPGAEPAAVRPVIVTAVLVSHDGATWLGECMEALALQTRPPDRLVIVDTGSVDNSRDIASAHERIRLTIGEVVAIDLPRGATFGEAVGRVAEDLAANRVAANRVAADRVAADHVAAEATASTEWLWLLHDDSAAAPDALAQLLDAARRSPSVGIAGPKLTLWDDPSRLLEVGQRVTRFGGRAGGPAPGEPDQGQHDHRSDVLGVNTSGMLLRCDVFDALGGFDPQFGQFGDDLDLCWRAHLAGHRVMVVPKARMREAAASANGRRSPGRSARAAKRRDRSHARQVALARCFLLAVPLVVLWVAVSSVVSAAVLLVVKRPRKAWEQLGDLWSLMTPWRPIAARWRARSIRRVRRRDLRGLFVSPVAGFRHGLDTIRDTVAFGSAPPADSGVGTRADSSQALETGPVADGGESVERLNAPVTVRVLRNPGFLAVLVGALLSVATWRSLLPSLISTNGLGVAGGELLPVSANAGGLWHAWLDGWHGAGLGNALEQAPYLPVMSGAAWVMEHLPVVGSPSSSVGASIGWLLAGAIPLSAFAAYLAARVVTPAPWPRAWASLAWASLATLTTAQAAGRLGAVVAHILLPFVVAGFVCAARRSTPTWVTFGTALALTVIGAFNPVLAALGALVAFLMLLAGLGLMLSGRGGQRLRAAVLLLVPAGLLGPWILRLADDPVQVLGGPGLTLWQGAAPAPWQLVLLHPGGPGSYPALLSAPILLAGVVAMSRRGAASGAMNALALLATAGLAVGLASSHVIVGHVPRGLPGAGEAITVWAGTGLDLAGLALIGAAVLGQDGLSRRLSRSGFGWRQILVPPVVVAAVVGVLASVALAGAEGAGKLLSPKEPNMPAVAAEQAEGPLANRLLVLNDDAGTVHYRLVGREPGMVVRDLPAPAVAADPLLAAAVRTALNDPDAPAVVNSRGSDSVKATLDSLSDLGIGFVAFRGASTEPLVRRLDATAGITRLSDTQGLILWRVQPRPNDVPSSRLRVEDAKGVPLQSVPATGDNGRTDVRVGAAPLGVARRLVVAQPHGWVEHARVTFAGRELSPLGASAQPTYELPPGPGQLTIGLEPARPWWRWGQLGLLLIVLFLAAPLGSSRARGTS